MTRTAPTSPGARALAGRAVLLSASTPAADRAAVFRRVPDAPREIEQAVVSLARAVFASGGRLVFGGHPSIAPLVAFVASAYDASAYDAPGGDERPREPLVTVHQLDVFREQQQVPDATIAMERLGHARIVWYETDEVEKRRPWARGEVRFPKSLDVMRRGMLDDPALAGMVCIGGMEGVLEEARMFAGRWQRPIFALARTGGAAALLAGDRPERPEAYIDGPRDAVTAIDRMVLDDPRMREPTLRGPDGEERLVPLRFTPYPLVMQELVRRIAQSTA